MLFNSYTFGLFLPIVFGLYLLLPLRGRQLMLLLASYLFYCWQTPVYGVLLLTSTVLDYTCGRLMPRYDDAPRMRRLILWVSMCGNLGLLGFFKYGDFLGANAMGVGRLLGFEGEWAPMGFILPVGISFYTFQTMSYTIQLYRRQIEPCRDLTTFALFVAFFPQLVAGPIERANKLIPQLQVYHRIRWDDVAEGGRRIIMGLFRKIVLADRFAIMVDRVFDQPGEHNALTVWVALLCFTSQIYFDFAGYADIAIGTARLFGVRLTENFRRPFVATSIADFWNRWHITLTSWLRDYLFNPLGGARRGGARMALNGVIVLLVCGLWHGAAWHFVLWGAFHAVHMVLYYLWRFWRKSRGQRGKAQYGLLTIFWMALAVHVVNAISGVFFRAPDLASVGRILASMFGFSPESRAAGPTEWYVYVFLGMVAAWWSLEFAMEYMGLDKRIRRLPWWVRTAALALMSAATLMLASNLNKPYIYFQF